MRSKEGEEMTTKYVCPICNKVEYSMGFPNQSGGTHPRTCKSHGEVIIVMEVKK